MEVRLLHPGTEVEVNIRGRVFTATVTGRAAGNGRVSIQPPKGVGYYAATARQIRRIISPAEHQLRLGESA